MSHQETIDDLHAEFCLLTGNRLALNYIRESAWSTYIDQGFTIDDLRLVIRWVRQQIASQERNGFSELSLQFRTFAADQWTVFEERLNLANKTFRPPARPVDVAHTTTLPDGQRITRMEKRTVITPPKEVAEVTDQALDDLYTQSAAALRDARQKIARS